MSIGIIILLAILYALLIIVNGFGIYNAEFVDDSKFYSRLLIVFAAIIWPVTLVLGLLGVVGVEAYKIIVKFFKWLIKGE